MPISINVPAIRKGTDTVLLEEQRPVVGGGIKHRGGPNLIQH